MPRPIPITAPTQAHLPVVDITEDLVLTKDGGAAVVLRSTALNFSLLSEKEQEATTTSYAQLLNSLSFSVQILVRSHKKDITNYLSFLAEQEGKQTNMKLKSLMTSYRRFILQIVKKRNVLEKEFFIVIPFFPLELGISPITLLNPLPPKKTRGVPFSKNYVVKKAKTILYPRRDHLIRQSGRLGIRIQQLTTEDLGKLFFRAYNPQEERAPEVTEN